MANQNPVNSFPSLLPNRPAEFSLFPQPGKISQLFQANEKYIYHKLPRNFDYGKDLVNFGPDEPYITFTPDDHSGLLNDLRQYESRVLAVASTTQDTVRIGKFMASNRGVMFLLKQYVSQNSNIFNETSLYNPTEVFLSIGANLAHLPAPTRHLDLSRGALGALAGLVGLSSVVGSPQPPAGTTAASNGVGVTLPKVNEGFGSGLLRSKTALKAKGMLQNKWASAQGGNSTLAGMFMDYVKSMAETVIPQTFLVKDQSAKYRSDEGTFDLMLSYYQQPTVITEKFGGTKKERLEQLLTSFSSKYYQASEFEKNDYKQTIKDLYRNSGVKTLDVTGINNFGFPTTGKHDKINILKVINTKGKNITELGSDTSVGFQSYNPTESDLIPFYFYDVVNEKMIPFRATFKGINENVNSPWEELKFIGRADSLYSYTGFTRTLSFSFLVTVNSILELSPTWNRINYLASIVKPATYTNRKMERVYNRFIVPPMVMLTIGDLYKWHPIVINSISILVPDDASWETFSETESDKWAYYMDKIKISDSIRDKIKIGQVPRQLEVSITCNLLEKERPEVGGTHFGHSPWDRENNEAIRGDVLYLPNSENLGFSREITTIKESEYVDNEDRSKWIDTNPNSPLTDRTNLS